MVARKDLSVEWRARETLVPTLLVGLVVVAVGLLAFHDVAERRAVAAATLWLALAFATGVGLARAFGAEKDRGTLDVLLTLPVERGSVYLGKVAASFATLLVVALVTVPVYVVASGESYQPAWAGLVALVALGALGLAASGTMLSALAAQARSRDALLPVLLMPVLLPLLIAGIHGTMSTLGGESFAAWRGEVAVIAGYDVAMLAASWLLFDQAVG
jgi:heme exporter protein B